MRIAVPREIKPLEGRVGLIPAACSELVAAGHEVLVETGAGLLSGYEDRAYQDAGAQIVADAAALYRQGELIVKVKEPVEGDLQHLRAGHILFSYLHLAANEALTRKLCDIGLTAVAFETVQTAAGALPLLAPMSDIAGRLSIQLGTGLLHQPQGGKGLLLGGLPGAERGRVTVIGAGMAGGNAALLAAALGATVTVFDRKRERLEAMRALGDNVSALYPYADSVAQAVVEADLVVGAVLIPGARAPHVVTAAHIRAMQAGSVVVDISVDQGGCIETTHPTDYRTPTYVVDGVVHLAVTNMPGAVPRSASQALSAAVTPYLLLLAAGGLEENSELRHGLNVAAGKVRHPALLSSLDSK
ncbi:MAG TPA: alanine dehydrogenase [Gammaproteobacteria bacterium]|nr:alanine dehydrogenase [Gammaproteobacteria bacterium]